MPNDGAKRAIGEMEIERTALDQIMDRLSFAATDETDSLPIQTLGGMTARLVNRGKPAGYVVTSEGTFMVTVEIVSRAVMASEP